MLILTAAIKKNFIVVPSNRFVITAITRKQLARSMGGGPKKFQTGERRARGAFRARKIPNVGNPVNWGYMPAKKPKGLIKRHETKAEQQARRDKESALAPERGLPREEPARLAGMPVAAATWRRLMRDFASLEDNFTTRLDLDMLINYCVLNEQATQLDEMRSEAFDVWKTLREMWREYKLEGDHVSAIALIEKIQNAFDTIVKIDARVDQKRKAIFQLQQSLYMTPRARAGAVPESKKEEPPPDEMESLLGEVVDWVNDKNGNRDE
jgi:hypothetical protein